MAFPNYTDYLTNASNPFYLHPNESPAVILVTPVLDNKNYHNWARLMLIALISKNKEKFIDGTLLKPPITDPMYATWMRCNNMVLAWFQRSVSESIAKSILSIPTAAGVWCDLKNCYSQGDIFRISDIQEELYRFRQGNLDVSDYFTSLRVFWDELEDYRPIPFCKCSIAYTCGGYASMKVFREQDYVIRFLKGLNERYSHTKSQIMAMDPLPDVGKVFSLVLQQERELLGNNSLTSDSADTALAMAVNASKGTGNGGNFWNRGNSGFNSNSNPNGNGNAKGKNTYANKNQYGNQTGNQRFCTHCNRYNHTINTCFVLHGFPPGYKQKGKGQGQANCATVDTPATPLADSSTTQHQPSQFNGFTQEQFQGILTLIQQSQQSQPTKSDVHQSNSVTTHPLAFSTGTNIVDEYFYEDDWYS